MRLIFTLLFLLSVADAFADFQTVSWEQRSGIIQKVEQLVQNSQLSCSDGSSVARIASDLDSAHSVAIDNNGLPVYRLRSSCCSRDIYSTTELFVSTSDDGSQLLKLERVNNPGSTVVCQ
jgi:hypothetical protein